MTKNQNWQDDYWLLLMQLYLRQPVGVKPVYCRPLVQLSLELHIAPEDLHKRMSQIARLDTPRIERIWEDYSRNPKRLSRAVSLLRSMMGFNSGGDFYEGVEVEETFDLYFQLTPATMVPETPEVQDMARLLKLPVGLVVDVLVVFQHCDPYLTRRPADGHPLLKACKAIWQRYGNADTKELMTLVSELTEYFK